MKHIESTSVSTTTARIPRLVPRLVILSIAILSIIAMQPSWAEEGEAAAVVPSGDTSASILSHLHKVQLLGYEIAMHYHLYAAEQGDPKSAERMAEATDEASTLVTELADLLQTAEMADAGKTIASEWDQFYKLLKRNRSSIKSNGYAENQLVTDMLEHLKNLESVLSTTLATNKEQAGSQLNAQVDQIRTQSLLMQVIATKYAERSANVWGTNPSETEGDQTLDQLAIKFSQELTKISGQFSSSQEASDSLKQVATRWKFIEKSLVNYTENSIPFLVTRYSRKIVESLESVASIAENS